MAPHSTALSIPSRKDWASLLISVMFTILILSAFPYALAYFATAVKDQHIFHDSMRFLPWQHFDALSNACYHFDPLSSVCRNVVSRFQCVDVFPDTEKTMPNRCVRFYHILDNHRKIGDFQPLFLDIKTTHSTCLESLLLMSYQLQIPWNERFDSGEWMFIEWRLLVACDDVYAISAAYSAFIPVGLSSAISSIAKSTQEFLCE